MLVPFLTQFCVTPADTELSGLFYLIVLVEGLVQGDQEVSVNLMITVQKHATTF
jgi:hypothetical protein